MTQILIVICICKSRAHRPGFGLNFGSAVKKKDLWVALRSKSCKIVFTHDTCCSYFILHMDSPSSSKSIFIFYFGYLKPRDDSKRLPDSRSTPTNPPYTHTFIRYLHNMGIVVTTSMNIAQMRRQRIYNHVMLNMIL